MTTSPTGYICALCWTKDRFDALLRTGARICQPCYDRTPSPQAIDLPTMAEEARARRAKSRPKPDPLIARNKLLQKNFGITHEDYLRMLAAQGGVCGICGSDSPGTKAAYFPVDHDHGCCPSLPTCGRCIRGLLCVRCNWAVEIVLEVGAGRFDRYLRDRRPSVPRPAEAPAYLALW